MHESGARFPQAFLGVLFVLILGVFAWVLSRDRAPVSAPAADRMRSGVAEDARSNEPVTQPGATERSTSAARTKVADAADPGVAEHRTKLDRSSLELEPRQVDRLEHALLPRHEDTPSSWRRFGLATRLEEMTSRERRRDGSYVYRLPFPGVWTSTWNVAYRTDAFAVVEQRLGSSLELAVRDTDVAQDFTHVLDRAAVDEAMGIPRHR